MKIIAQHRALIAFAVAGLVVAAAQAEPGDPETIWGWQPSPAVGEAVPPLPPPSTYPVQLLLDDDTSDGAFGVAGQTARQFLWFNRFTPAAGFHLDQVWVLFPSGANMAVGGAVQIAIYEDPDGDPTNGANLIASFNDTIQAADDNTFSIYGVPGSPVIPGGSDLLVGVVPRFITSGVTPPTFPAAMDTTATQSRSWVAAWTTDPPDPPVLVPLPDQTLSLVDVFVPGGGNFMIRAFGTSQSVTEIPTLGGIGLVALALALVAAGAVLLRRRSARSSGGAGAALGLLFLALATPAGAVTVDTFTAVQGAVSDPGGASSSVTGVAGDPIGTRRGMVVDLLTGAGPTTASVAGGNLVLTVTNTTPDSRGEVLVSWDGDTNPLVLAPTGLSNADLTAGNATGFLLDFVSTTVVTEIEITVYEDAANFSRAVRRVAIGGVQSVRIPFAEFRIAGGTGAVFSSVGAIEMTLRSGEGTATLSAVTTTAPTVGATKVDTLNVVDVDGDTRVDPGDRLRYTVTITNTGNQALAADLTDTISGNTTLVAGTVSSTPVAHNDQYGWFGNVTLNVDGVTSHPLLLANDADADGDDVDVQSVVSPTAAGGTVTLDDAETGEFTYTPPAGFKGVDSFSYTINDGESHTATATAYVHLEGIVWFVDNACTVGCGAGTQSSPFQTLPAAETPSGDNDIIYVRTGLAAYDTGPANGFTMDVDEQLLGEGVALVLGGTTIVPVGTPPTLTNNDGTPGRGLTLAGTGVGTDTVRGLTIGVTGAAKIFGSAFGTFASDTVTLNGNGQALHLVNGVLASTFASITSGSSALSGITLQQVSGTLTATGGTSITNPTTQGILVDQSTASVAFGNTSITGTGTDRISLQNNSAGTRTFGTLTTTGGTGVGFLHAVGGGTTTVTGATSITNPGGIGISIASSTTAVTFASTTINKGASAGTGVSLAGNSGTTTFSNLAVTTSNGTGILASTSPLSLGGTGSTVAATGGPALDLTTVNLGAGATFTSVSSTGSAGKGMNLDTLTGSLTMNAGSIATPAGIAFDLNAGAGNVTYTGAISNVANALLIDITGRTGGTVNLSGNLSSITLGDGINVASNTGGTINFSGGTKTLNTVAAPAVTLATNTGATINFTGGGLAITTTSGAGFKATGGATAITVQGTGNTISSTTGTALEVTSTTIGGSGLTFQSISSNGAASGIVLSSTGSSGGLTVTGNSAGSCGGTVGSGPPASAAPTTAPATGDCTGGTIQASSGPGISLANTSNVSLTRMWVLNSGDDGIQGTNVTNFQLTSSLLDNNGNALDDNNIDFGGNSSLTPDGLRGTGAVTNSTLRNGYDRGLSIRNINGAALAPFTVTGSQIRGRAAENNNNDGILFEALGTASITGTVSGSFFAANKGDHFQAAGVNSGTLTVTFLNNTLTGGHSSALGQGITINAATGVAFGGWTGQITYDVNGNNINGAISNGVSVVQGTSGATGAFIGKVRNNVIGTSGVLLSCSTQAAGIYIDARGNGTHTSAVTDNTIRQCLDRGMLSEAGDGDSVLNLTVTGNTVAELVDPLAREAFATNYGITSSNVFSNIDSNTVCLQLGGAGALANNLTHGPGAPDDFRLRKRFEATVRLPGYAGGTGQDATSLGQVVAFIQGQNTGSAGEPGSATASGTGGGYTGGAACPTPP